MRVGLIGPIERRQLDAGTSRAQHDGRDGHMQPIETSRRDKARHGIGAALDQHPAHPGTRKRGHDGRRRNIPVLRRQGNDLNAGRRCALRSVGRNQQATNAVVGEQLGIRSETPSRIDHGTRRLRSGDLPDRQLRIISNRRSDADHDDVDQRTQPVQMFDAGRTIDVLRMTGRRRDPTIERLADLPDNHRSSTAPLRRGPNKSAQTCGRGCCPLRNNATKSPMIGRRKFAGGEIAELHG